LTIADQLGEKFAVRFWAQQPSEYLREYTQPSILS